MHLRSIAMKGFKSFPDRTTLVFSPGVSVVVGPNGSGKSNVTDAVLWALGEQSPLAVRGQTMQDVIFAGGHGVPARDAAEVEVVIDNGDGALPTDFSELSIVRRLERSGEGEYRLNGARCRLVDVLEVLSDSGLGREMHSVVSQGRVDHIVNSRPRDRRLLIEEAAGLGKHRKRRRRAQLKLARTEQNLSRALDVEREARSRLRPLKRQAEAAELTARLERQSLEARFELAREAGRETSVRRAEAEARAAAALTERDEADRLLAAVGARRQAAEEAFAARARSRDALSRAVFGARAAEDRIGVRLERALDVARAAGEAAVRAERELESLTAQPESGEPAGRAERLEQLEAELEALDATLQERLEAEVSALESDRAATARRRAECERALQVRRAELREAERAALEARRSRREAERAAEGARAEAARTGGELASVNHFLRGAGTLPGARRTLAEDLGVEPGYELAVAAVLGPLLRAAIAPDIAEAEALLDATGGAGGAALVAAEAGDGSSLASSRPAGLPPTAEPLMAHVDPLPALAAAAERLLAGAWLVESLAGLPPGFQGAAVTRGGRALFGRTGVIRQAAAGGEDRVLAETARREQLVAASERAARLEAATAARLQAAVEGVSRADEGRDAAEVAVRAAGRALQDAGEELARLERLITGRSAAPNEGPAAIRRAELAAELRAERALAERAEGERRRLLERMEALRGRVARQEALRTMAERAAAALQAGAEVVATRAEHLAERLADDGEVADRTAAELRACATRESELQARLRAASEAVTGAEVAAHRARDAATEADGQLRRLAERLGLPAKRGSEPLGEARRVELEGRLERLARRREQLGPVNPLAQSEYEDAVAHVEELEGQRADLESALGELEGLIRETDRRIRESFDQTFTATAAHFEELVGHLFPGGRGRLRLVHPNLPRPVIGDALPGSAAPPAGAETDAAGHPLAGEARAEAEDTGEETEEPGVEVEVTPAGKSMKRLSLLSGGEKSLVALAFLFAVFLARPCPFYILDEVEAALDDLNIDRFLELVRRYSDRAQFIIVTHQKRTMDAADALYGVSMGTDGVSRVVSRRLAGARAVQGAPGPALIGDSEAAA